MKILNANLVILLTIFLSACGGGSSGSSNVISENETKEAKEFTVKTQVFNFASQAGMGGISAIEVRASSTTTTPEIDKLIFDLSIFGSSAGNTITVPYSEPESASYPIRLDLNDGNTQEQLATMSMRANPINNSKLIFAFGAKDNYKLKAFDKPKFIKYSNKSNLAVINLSGIEKLQKNSTFSIRIEGETILEGVKAQELSPLISLNKYAKDIMEFEFVGDIDTTKCNISQMDIDSKENSVVVLYDLVNTDKVTCSVIEAF